MQGNCEILRFIIHMITKGQALAFLGLLNGMVGGTVLVLPLIGMQTGYLLIPIVAIIYGLISYYSCHIIITHLGESRQLKQVILEHFNNKEWVLAAYNAIIALSFVILIINYFQLIIKQLQGFIPPSKWIAIGVLIFLIALTVVMRYIRFGERLLAFGILSIIGYLSFLTWAQVTAPHEPKYLPAAGPKFIDLAASLIMGYSIQNFIVQVLFKTTTNDKFHKVVAWVYIAGTLVYTYISYGAYAIINRQPRVQEPQTISQYFPRDGWQVRTIEGIYLFHLFSATPQFVIIMRQRLLEIFKIQETPHITFLQFCVYTGLYSLCYLLYTFKIKIALIIELNGSVIGFFIVFLIPIVLHIKCVFFNKRDQNGIMIIEQKQKDGTIKEVQSNCKCKVQYQNQYSKYLELIFQAIIMIIGLCTVFYTLKLMFWGTGNEVKSEQL